MMQAATSYMVLAKKQYIEYIFCADVPCANARDRLQALRH
jgi:hypothetical protein